MSIILVLWAKTSRRFGKKISTRIVKTAFYVYRGTCRWAFLEKKFHLIILHSRFLFAKKYTTFGRKFMAFVLTMQSACPGEHFEGKQVFEKNKKFHLFRALRGKISNCRQTKVSRFFKIALHVSRWTFRGPFSWKKNIFSLPPPDFEQTIMRLFGGRNQHVRQNCILRLQRDVLRFFSENLHFFSSILDFICEGISNCWRQICGLLVKNAVWVSKRTFWKKNDFFERKIYICPYWLFLNSSQFFPEF